MSELDRRSGGAHELAGMQPDAAVSASDPGASASPTFDFTWRGELTGALGATAAMLPFVLSYGFIAFGALGPAAAQVGLGASVLSVVLGAWLFAALSRSRMPAASPSASSTIILSGAVLALVRDPTLRQQLPLLLAAVASVVAASGLLTMGLGLLRAGSLVRYVPQPVLAGFMNGVAILIGLSQVPPLLGLPAGAWERQGLSALAGWQAGALAVALGTAALVALIGRRWPRAPAPVLALLLAGTAVWAWQAAGSPPTGSALRVIGPLQPALPWPDVLAPLLHEAGRAALRPHLGTLAVTALLLALIGSLESVLNLAAVDQLSGERSAPNRELVALGLTNVLGATLGGLPLVYLRLRALAGWAAGGRTWRTPVLDAGALVLVFTLGLPLVQRLPTAVVAGIVVMLAWALVDRWSGRLVVQVLRGDRSADTLRNLAVVVLVCAATAVWGFVAGVGLGIVAAMLIVIGALERNLVRTRCTAVQLPSRRARRAPQEALLGNARPRIHVLELEGALFFGNSERVRAEVDALPPDATDCVVDLRRVSTLDASGALALAQADATLRRRGARLHLAGVLPGNRHGQALRAQGLDLDTDGGDGLAVYPDADHAIEAAEEAALERLAPELSQRPVPLESCQLFEGLDPAQRQRLRSCLRELRLAPGQQLFATGDAGPALYLVTAGSVSVLDPARTHRYASFSPGMCFGETAVLGGGGRTADAVADGATVLHELGGEAMHVLQREDPALAAQVYRNLARHLSERLRAAASGWRAAAG